MGKSRGKAPGKGPFGGALGLHKPGSSGGVRMAGQNPLSQLVRGGGARGKGEGPFKEMMGLHKPGGSGGRRGRRWGLGGASAKGMGGAVSAATQDKDPNCPT